MLRRRRIDTLPKSRCSTVRRSLIRQRGFPFAGNRLGSGAASGTTTGRPWPKASPPRRRGRAWNCHRRLSRKS